MSYNEFANNRMQPPSITVILPAYNAEKYILDSMDSILNQTYENFELIIINDGSTDSTANLILSRNDKRIILLENKKNLGIVNALNKGISMSKGQYIARMDSDDISAPRRLEKQIEFLSEEKKDRHTRNRLQDPWHR